MHHPGFNCPLCRTFANLEEDVEVENEEIEEVDVEAISGENGGDGVSDVVNSSGSYVMLSNASGDASVSLVTGIARISRG